MLKLHPSPPPPPPTTWSQSTWEDAVAVAEVQMRRHAHYLQRTGSRAIGGGPVALRP